MKRRESRHDDGRLIRRTRNCDFCSAPPIAQHAANCIFGENGRLPLTGPRRHQAPQQQELVVSDAADGQAAAIAKGLDIFICTPRQAEAIVKVEWNGRRIAEAIESARRQDEWAAIK